MTSGIINNGAFARYQSIDHLRLGVSRVDGLRGLWSQENLAFLSLGVVLTTEILSDYARILLSFEICSRLISKQSSFPSVVFFGK